MIMKNKEIVNTSKSNTEVMRSDAETNKGERVSPCPEDFDVVLDNDSRAQECVKSEISPSDVEGRHGLSTEEGLGNEHMSEKDINSDNENGSSNNNLECNNSNEETNAETGFKISNKIFETLKLPTSARLTPTVGSYLEKLSPTAFKGFQKRFFKLNLTDNALLYWREEPTFPDQQPSGCINLSSVIAIHIEDALNFVIRTFGRDYCLRALSPGDKDIWLESICMVVNAVTRVETLKDASNHYNFSKVLLDTSGNIQTYLTEALKTQRKVKWAKEDKVPLTFSLRGKKMFLRAKGIQRSLARLWFDYVFSVKCLSPSASPYLSLYPDIPGNSTGNQFLGNIHGQTQGQSYLQNSSSSHHSPSSFSLKTSRGMIDSSGGGTIGSRRRYYRTRSSSYCTSTCSSSPPTTGYCLKNDEGVTSATGLTISNNRKPIPGHFYGTYRGQNLKISKSMMGAELSSLKRTKTLRDLSGFGNINQNPEGSKHSEPNIQSFTRMRSHLDNVLFGTIYAEIGPLPTLEHLVQNISLNSSTSGGMPGSDSSSSSSSSSSNSPNPPLSSLQKFFALLISSRPIANNEAFFPLPNNFSLKPCDTKTLGSKLGYSPNVNSVSASSNSSLGLSSSVTGDYREIESLPFNIQLDCLYLFSPDYDGSPPLYVIELDNIQLSSKIREVQTGFQFRLQVPMGSILASLRSQDCNEGYQEEVHITTDDEVEGQKDDQKETNQSTLEGGLENVGSGGGGGVGDSEEFMSQDDEKEEESHEGHKKVISTDLSGSDKELDTNSQIPPHSEIGQNMGDLNGLASNIESETNTVAMTSPVCGANNTTNTTSTTNNTTNSTNAALGQNSQFKDTKYTSITNLFQNSSLILYGLGGNNSKCHNELFQSISTMSADLAKNGIVFGGENNIGINNILSSEKVSMRIISIFGPDAEIWREALIASCRARHAAKENRLRTLHDELRAFDSIPKELLDENITHLFYKTLVYISAISGINSNGTTGIGSSGIMSGNFGGLMCSNNDFRRISPLVGVLSDSYHNINFHSGCRNGLESAIVGRNWIRRMVYQISSSFVTIPIPRILQGLEVFNLTGRDLLQASIRMISNPRVDILRFVHDKYVIPILMVIQECFTRRNELMRELDILLILEFLVDLRLSYESCGIYDSKFKYLILNFSSLYMKKLVQPYYSKIFKSIHNTCFLGKTFRDKESGTLRISLFSEAFSSLNSMVNLFTSLRFYHYSVEVRNVLFMTVQNALMQYQLAIRDVVLHNLCSLTELGHEKQNFFFYDDSKKYEGGLLKKEGYDGCTVVGSDCLCWRCYFNQRPFFEEMDYSRIPISSEVICGLLNGIEYCICKCDELDILLERWNPFLLYKFEQEYFKNGAVLMDNNIGILVNNTMVGIGKRMNTTQSMEVTDTNIGNMSGIITSSGDSITVTNNLNGNNNSNSTIGSVIDMKRWYLDQQILYPGGTRFLY
ncbi:hypothetical protein [Cryptosporidium hominis TU502]|uniref:hypothetical protein n=1 Tax=Cryptosporidium hominis (strain TU502) TaxID=353151 RepID=UPI0000452FCE|nr:hypothetical protein [Cryptosporidium hominis TU502]